MFSQFKFIIFSACRLAREKRISDALSAFADVAKDYPEVGFVIAGEGPLRQELEKRAESLGLSGKVVFLGFRPDVFALMKSADMFLSVSEYEGYGMSLVEAGAARLAVLSTDVGLYGELLTHLRNSYICPVYDTKCIAEGIKTLMNEGDLRRRLAGELFDSVNLRMGSKEEYVKSYVMLLQEAAHNNFETNTK